MSKPAIAQVLEQISRMAVIFLFSSLFIHRGISYACALAVLGLSAGEIISFIYIFIAYRYDKNRKTYKKAFHWHIKVILSFIINGHSFNYKQIYYFSS